MPQTTLEERIAALEGSYREITKRIDDLRSEMHRGFDAIKGEMGTMETRLVGQMVELRTEARTAQRWTMTLILVNWLSIMAAIFLTNFRR